MFEGRLQGIGQPGRKDPVTRVTGFEKPTTVASSDHKYPFAFRSVLLPAHFPFVNIRPTHVARQRIGQRLHKPDAQARDTTVHVSTVEGDGCVARCVPRLRVGLVYFARHQVVVPRVGQILTSFQPSGPPESRHRANPRIFFQIRERFRASSDMYG